MADKIVYTGTTTGGHSYTELKAKASSALTTVGRTWTWANTPSVGTKITAAQLIEIQNAISYAYDGINYGCSSNYSNNKSSQYSYGSCSTTLSSQYSGANSSEGGCSSNLSARNSTKYGTVYSSNKGHN